MKYLTTSLCTLVLFLSSAYATATQSIQSDGQMLEIDQATICHGSSVTMKIPQEAIIDNYSWTKDNLTIGKGPSFSINSFSPENAGIYVLTQNFSDGSFAQTIFKLHHLSLGKDRSECESQTIEFNLADGPDYTWSNGSTSNAFKVTFEESGTIDVSAVTEFGCIIEDELLVKINQINTELSVSPIDGSCNQSFVNLNIDASSSAYPAYVYADFEGEQILLAQFNFEGTKKLEKEKGSYTNVHVLADNGCLIALSDFTIIDNSSFLKGPFKRLIYTQQKIQETNTCQSAAVNESACNDSFNNIFDALPQIKKKMKQYDSASNHKAVSIDLEDHRARQTFG